MEIAQTRLHFKNPPIVEAVIAFTVEPIKMTGIEAFEKCIDEVKQEGYSTPERVQQFQLSIQAQGGMSQPSVIGLKFLSENGSYAIQFLTNAFVISRLGMYSCWEDLRDEAKKLWRIYQRAGNNPGILRVGVRYVNKLFFPQGEDAEQYVCAGPKIPPKLQPLTEMFMRVGIPIAEPSGTFIHTQVLLPIEKPGFTTLLLDNDLQFPVEGRQEADVWSILESARELKDDFFEQLTTSKMRETFND